MKSGLARRLERHLRRSRLVPEGLPVLVALSGGGDSVALLHLLKDLGHPVRAAHLDHALRPDSRDDLDFVRTLCREAGVPLTTTRLDVGALARRLGLSPEAAGRRARYRFLRRVRLRHGRPVVATAHTADDQAETVLLRILAGTGIAGLGGIRPRRRDGVVRPLLPFSRESLRDYLVRRGLAWREDPTNLVPQAPRTRVRLQLMPMLRSWNPRVVEALGRLARHARSDDRLLARLARQAMSSASPLDVEALRNQPEPLRRRLLAAAGASLETSHLEALDRLLEGPAGREVHLPGHRVARRTLRHVVFEGQGVQTEAPPEATVNLDGTTELPEWGLQFTATPIAAARPPEPWALSLDADVLDLPLVLRSRRPGDRFRPAGGAGTVKLKKFLLERRVESRERDRVPILASGGRLVWVVGHRGDARFLAGPDSRRVVLLEAKPLERP